MKNMTLMFNFFLRRSVSLNESFPVHTLFLTLLLESSNSNSNTASVREQEYFAHPRVQFRVTLSTSNESNILIKFELIIHPLKH